MARIPLVRLDGTGETRARGMTRLVLLAGRRWLGREADPVGAAAHNSGILWRTLVSGGVNTRRRSVLPDGLAELVTFVTAVDIGCSWCVDFGASVWERKGLDPQILREAVNWRTSDRFDADQRAAFDYAEAVTAQPPQVDDAMVADLRARFGDAGVVELTYLIAFENLASRFNSSLGLSTQGFSSGDACALAAAAGGAAGRAAG
jgi:AhpD family alkylhydroperoxidase